MFIRWKSFGDMLTRLTSALTENAMLREQLAGERARFDWLAAHVNELKIERAQLYQRIGIDLPVPLIERTAANAPAPGLPGADDNYAPPPGSVPMNLGDVLARQRERRAAVAREPIVPRELSFEDVGDEAAARLGLARDAEGVLIDELPVTR